MTRKLFTACTAISIGCLLSMIAIHFDAKAATVSNFEPPVFQKAFRPYGYYSLVGTHPRGFENFDTIQYWRKDQEQSGPDISERLSGVTADEGVLYRYANLSLNRRRFAFNTVRVKGISYSFSGRFLRTDFVNADLDFDKPVLSGTLRKYRNGKKVAESRVRLSYFAGT